eukprot:403338234
MVRKAALLTLTTLSTINLLNALSNVELSQSYYIDYFKNSDSKQDWIYEKCMPYFARYNQKRPDGSLYAISNVNCDDKQLAVNLFNNKLEHLANNQDKDILIEFGVQFKGEDSKAYAELQLLHKLAGPQEALKGGTSGGKIEPSQFYEKPRLTFGVSMSNKAGNDQSDMSVYINFRKDHDQLWQNQHALNIQHTSQRTDPHLFSLLWRQSGHYSLYMDDKIVHYGSISHDFRSQENRVRGCGASIENYDPTNPVFIISNQTLLNELNTMPKYLDSERKIINEEYVFKRIEVEKEITNQYRKEPVRIEENRLSERNSHGFDESIDSIGLSLFSETEEIQIQRIVFAIVNMKREDL